MYCELVSTFENVKIICRKARALMERVMNKGHDIMPNSHISGPPDGGSTMIEIMIPGNKAGIIIGKGGETIKQLQVQILFIHATNFLILFDKLIQIVYLWREQAA